jgi:ribonuclease HII
MVRKTVKIRKNFYEKSLWELDKLVVGIDEVGRGCLAGPLVTAAVILSKNRTSPLLKDSKLLSAEEREKAFQWITRHCQYQWAIVHNRLIDQHNIYQATKIGMKKALVSLMAHCNAPIGAILIDAMPLELVKTGISNVPVYHFYKGETKSSSIAAASIVAKVTRDHLMKEFGPIFPGYAFEQHKGYATPVHREAIDNLQQTLIHRTTFLGAFLDQGEVDDHSDQQTLF